MRAAGSLYLVFVGLLFVAAGGCFSWLMWRSFERAAGQRDLKEVKCEILESQVEQRKIGPEVGTEYRFAVLFGYEFEGKPYTSDRYSLRGSGWSSSDAKAERVVERFPVGARPSCFVNPSDPSFALLELDSKAPGYSLWFPLLIVVGGLGIVVGAVRGWLRGNRNPVPERETRTPNSR